MGRLDGRRHLGVGQHDCVVRQFCHLRLRCSLTAADVVLPSLLPRPRTAAPGGAPPLLAHVSRDACSVGPHTGLAVDRTPGVCRDGLDGPPCLESLCYVHVRRPLRPPHPEEPRALPPLHRLARQQELEAVGGVDDRGARRWRLGGGGARKRRGALPRFAAGRRAGVRPREQRGYRALCEDGVGEAREGHRLHLAQLARLWALQVCGADGVGQRGAAVRRREPADLARQSVHQAGPERRGEAGGHQRAARLPLGVPLARRARRADVREPAVVRRRCPAPRSRRV